MRQSASRFHDCSIGHKVTNHESKCAHLHGHNYRIHFTVEGDLDDIGRVMDFSVIKDRLCMWLEYSWDHKFLIYELDPIAADLAAADPDGVILVDFNPTAENMAAFLLNSIGPKQLEGTGVTLTSVVIEETRKCAASATMK